MKMTLADKTIWSDEATFNLSGTVNRHDTIYWASENPHQLLVKHMKSPSISVLARISSKGLLGPYFFPATVTGKSFLKIMQEEMTPSLKTLYEDTEVIFQLDAAPGHWEKDVREFLNLNFSDKWIGRGGPIP